MEPFKIGDIVRCWDLGHSQYVIRRHTGQDSGAYETDGRTHFWFHIEHAHPSEYGQTDPRMRYNVAGRDRSHLTTKPTGETKLKPKQTKYMVRNQSTSYTSQKHDTYEEAVAEANRLCTTSKSYDKFEILQVVAVVSPQVTATVEEV